MVLVLEHCMHKSFGKQKKPSFFWGRLFFWLRCLFARINCAPEAHNSSYGNRKETKTLRDIVDFHYRFERIHPFQDGNGRVGRLLLFKECLKYNIVPFIIEDRKKMFYYRGLREWNNERGFLIETCLDGQDTYKALLKYFKIKYND